MNSCESERVPVGLRRRTLELRLFIVFTIIFVVTGIAAVLVGEYLVMAIMAAAELIIVIAEIAQRKSKKKPYVLISCDGDRLYFAAVSPYYRFVAAESSDVAFELPEFDYPETEPTEADLERELEPDFGVCPKSREEIGEASVWLAEIISCELFRPDRASFGIAVETAQGVHYVAELYDPVTVCDRICFILEEKHRDQISR